MSATDLDFGLGIVEMSENVTEVHVEPLPHAGHLM
jgi:hypothetical protein